MKSYCLIKKSVATISIKTFTERLYGDFENGDFESQPKFQAGA